MAHLDLKVRLQDADHAAQLQKTLTAKGASLFFQGSETDNIYFGSDGAFVKHRRTVGLGNASGVNDPESDEIAGANNGPLVAVDKSWAIHYRQAMAPSLPSPHYLVTVGSSVLKGIGKNIYTDRNLYADVEKPQRSVYWLIQKDAVQGSRQSNLRFHFDRMHFGEDAYFMEVEAKFANAYTPQDLQQAHDDLEKIKRDLNINDADIVHKSYGRLKREQVLGDLSLSNEWVDMMPLGLLQEFAASKREIFAADQNLMVENGPNDGAYILLNGAARVFYDDKTYDFGDGYVLGELATFNKTDRRCATVTALQPTAALHLSKELTADLCACPNVLGSWLKRYAPTPVRA